MSAEHSLLLLFKAMLVGKDSALIGGGDGNRTDGAVYCSYKALTRLEEIQLLSKSQDCGEVPYRQQKA